MLRGKLWNTLFMMGTAMALALILGVVIGTFLAWKRGTGIDTGGIAVFLALRSAPEFWFAIRSASEARISAFSGNSGCSRKLNCGMATDETGVLIPTD